MAATCKNCGAMLTFDPAAQMLVCEYCNGRFKPEEIETERKSYIEDQEAVAANEVYGTEDE